MEFSFRFIIGKSNHSFMRSISILAQFLTFLVVHDFFESLLISTNLEGQSLSKLLIIDRNNN